MERWFETGSAHLRNTSGADMVANPTLLQPGTWAWQVHYRSCAFSNYYPLEPTDSLSGSSQQLLEVIRPFSSMFPPFRKPMLDYARFRVFRNSEPSML